MMKEIWPGWETVEAIGAGGFSKVYKIRKVDASGEYYSALKTITIPQSGSEYDAYVMDGYDDASITEIFTSQVKRLVEEFRLMAQFKGNSNIVSYEDHMIVPHEDGKGWDILIRMELLDPLPKFCTRQAMSEQEIVKLGIDICRALELCQKKGIIHRDIKPQNIFVNEFGAYKLGDFGIAKSMDHTTHATKTGTYSYMAPEVYRGEAYGATIDLYSLGLVLYWLLNERRLPFLPLPPAVPTANQINESQARRFAGEVIPAPKYGSNALKAIIRKACAYRAEERYTSPTQMRQDLERATRWIAPGSMPMPAPQADHTVSLFDAAGGNTGSRSRTVAPQNPYYRANAPVRQTDYARPVPPVSPVFDGNERTQSGVTVGTQSDRTEVIPSNGRPTDSTVGLFDKRAQKPVEQIPASAPAMHAPMATAAATVKTEEVTARPAPIKKKGSGGVISVLCILAVLAALLSVTIWRINDLYTQYQLEKNYVLSYELNEEGTYTVVGIGTFGGTELEIPSSYQGVAVTAIGYQAFYQYTNLESVVIPDSVTVIGESAFEGCTNLTRVKLPDNYLMIDYAAFYDCSSLQKIVIPYNAYWIGRYAFGGCTSLKSVTFEYKDNWYLKDENGEIYYADILGDPQQAAGYLVEDAVSCYWYYSTDGQ
ncbi:MAG: leucine-rich repeat protein [Clostridia bacterium]|nr:leucine-rich repeat protein [Clostridia bacterium]